MQDQEQPTQDLPKEFTESLVLAEKQLEEQFFAAMEFVNRIAQDDSAANDLSLVLIAANALAMNQLSIKLAAHAVNLGEK